MKIKGYIKIPACEIPFEFEVGELSHHLDIANRVEAYIEKHVAKYLLKSSKIFLDLTRDE